MFLKKIPQNIGRIWIRISEKFIAGSEINHSGSATLTITSCMTGRRVHWSPWWGHHLQNQTRWACSLAQTWNIFHTFYILKNHEHKIKIQYEKLLLWFLIKIFSPLIWRENNLILMWVFGLKCINAKEGEILPNILAEKLNHVVLKLALKINMNNYLKFYFYF